MRKYRFAGPWSASRPTGDEYTEKGPVSVFGIRSGASRLIGRLATRAFRQGIRCSEEFRFLIGE